MSRVIIELSESIQASLQVQPQELPRFALEAMALEGYRQEVLSQRQVGEMLGLDF